MSELIQCHNREEWDDYVLDNDGHPLQLWGWGEVKHASGWSVERLFLKNEEGDILGAAQMLIRHLPWPLRSLSYVPRGPIVHEYNKAEFLEELAKFTKHNYRSVTALIEPDAVEFNPPDGWRKTPHSILPAETIILDLTLTEAELLSGMVKKTRQYIRKSAAEPVTIKRVRTREELDKCLTIYRETAKRAKFDLHDNRYYYDVFNNMGDNSQLFASYVDDQPVCFLWIAISADTAFELYGGMNDQGSQLRANYALKWHAIRKCKEWGLTRYDFGGLIDGGVSTFKKGWCLAGTTLAGTFDLPLSKSYFIWNNFLPLGKNIARGLKKLVRR